MKILNKEIKDEVSWGSIAAIITIVTGFVTGAYYFGVKLQSLEDEVINIRIEQIHTVETTKQQTAIVAAQVVANEARRDQSDTVIRDGLNRLNDHVNDLTNYLLGKQHGELNTLPHVASVNQTPWNNQ
jgi:hypothetical protein